MVREGRGLKVLGIEVSQGRERLGGLLLLELRLLQARGAQDVGGRRVDRDLGGLGDLLELGEGISWIRCHWVEC